MKGTEDTYQVSASLAELVSKGLDYSVLSEGAFDIAIEPLTSLWDFTAENPKVPKDSLIQAALPKCNYHNISVDTDKNEITLKTDDTAIELGAIAKGYIADRLKDYLVSQNVKSSNHQSWRKCSLYWRKNKTILLLRSGSRNHLQTEAKLLLLWTSGISQWFPQEFMRDALNRMALCIITCSILKPAILMITG